MSNLRIKMPDGYVLIRPSPAFCDPATGLFAPRTDITIWNDGRVYGSRLNYHVDNTEDNRKLQFEAFKKRQHR